MATARATALTPFQVEHSKEGVMSIEEALEKFLVQLEADGRSQHTVDQYARHVRLLARWATDVGITRDLGELDHEHVAMFFAAPDARTRPDGKPKRAGSMNALRSSVKGFFGYLVQAEIVERDPSRILGRARCGQPPPKALGPADQKRLLAVLSKAEEPVGQRDHVLFALMLGTGLRLSSAVLLDAEDVDLDDGRILVRHAKGDRVETVFLSRDLKALLATYMGNRATGPIFRAGNGRRVSIRHAQRRFRLWAQRAGISGRFSPHSLRHSFAMDLYRKTRDLLLVKEALHHRSITSTMVYARVDQERLRAALA